MTHTFQSSISAGGDVLFPETITINDKSVTWTKKMGLLVSRKTITLQRSSINSVQVNQSLLFGSDVIIETNGNSYIYASYFSRSDSNRIKEILLG
jgi:hypothetical protein